MSWYYKEGDKELGPVNKAQLQELIKRKAINAKTLIRSAADQNWRPLAEMVKTKAAKPQADAQDPAQSTHSSLPPQPPQPPPIQASESADDPHGAQMTPAMIMNNEASFQFKGSGGEYFRIWIVNVLLSIVTLGIYSAWAKVRRKQYFYSNLSVVGASFRYLADPVKILKGRMIVFLFLVVTVLINSVIPLISPLISLAILIAMPWFVVRALAFNARNSSWRNIRFNFKGTYGSAVKVFILWPLLTIPTLGILFPYVFYRQKRFIVEHSAYGTTSFSFKATPGNYYAIFAWFLLHIVIVGIAIILAFFGLGLLAETINEELFKQLIASLSFGLIFIYLLLYLYGFIYFSVRSTNLLYNSGQLARHRFKSTMKLGAYAAIVVTNTLATMVTFGLFHPFAQVRAFRYKIKNLSLLPDGDLEQFIAAEQQETSALGDEMADFLDFDLGI